MLLMILPSEAAEPLLVHPRDPQEILIPTALTPDGDVMVGWHGKGSQRPFRWTEATGVETLRVEDRDVHGLATDISDDGRTIGGMVDEWGVGLKYVVWRDGKAIATRNDRTFFDAFEALTLSADAERALILDAVQGWLLWSPGDSQVVTNPFPAWYGPAVMSRDGSTVFFAKDSRTAAKWTAAGTETLTGGDGTLQDILPLATTRDGRRAYFRVGTHTNLFVWTSEGGLAETGMGFRRSTVYGTTVRLSSDDRVLVTGWESDVYRVDGASLGSLTNWIGSGYAFREASAVSGNGPFHLALGWRNPGPAVLFRGLTFGLTNAGVVGPGVSTKPFRFTLEMASEAIGPWRDLTNMVLEGIGETNGIFRLRVER